jgi:hypothetical protein
VDRTGPHVVVEAGGELVEAVAPGREHLRGGVGLSRGEDDLFGQEQFPGAEECLTGRGLLGGELMISTPGQVDGMDQTSLEAEGRGAGGQDHRGIGAGPAASALPPVGSLGEQVALGAPLAQVPTGGVQDLDS